MWRARTLGGAAVTLARAARVPAMRYHSRACAARVAGPPTTEIPMPLCVYLCYTPGCQTKLERWMPTAEEGAAAKFKCPRCGTVMQVAWTGQQTPTPNLKDVTEIPRRR